uniref:Peptidase M12B domain-containing protein n=1 Tax=Syphacia muris TaxID=451379 RepID=A0A158R4L0_9BILA
MVVEVVVPPLTVIRSSNKETFGYAKILANVEPSTTFLYQQEGHSQFVLYKLFPKTGGEFALGKTRYINKGVNRRRPKVRLLFVFPHDVDQSAMSLSVIRGAKLAAVVAQTVIGLEITKFKKHLRKKNSGSTITFEFESDYKEKCCGSTFIFAHFLHAFEFYVPDEMKTYSGSSRIFLSGSVQDNDSTCIPEHAVLIVNKSSPELYSCQRLAYYIKECLQRLDELFQTFRDVSVIKSKALNILPSSVSQLFSTFNCVDKIDAINCRSFLRIIQKGDHGCIKVGHTVGGVVSSLYGSVLHEIGHLFKLPHTHRGVMANGGDNIQQLFVLDPLTNLAVKPEKSKSIVGVDLAQVRRCKSLETIIDQSMFDDISKELLCLSNFVNWQEDLVLAPIHVDLRVRTVRSSAGLLYVIYNEDTPDSRLKLVSRIHLKKQAKLLHCASKMRIVVVAADGNFLSITA